MTRRRTPHPSAPIPRVLRPMALGSLLTLGSLLALVLPVLGCGGGTPIRHYTARVLPEQVETASTQAPGVLFVRTFSADAAYAERRIVYRESPVQFDYYHFHRWAAEPGKMVSNVLREVYRRSGRFEAVVGDFTPHVNVMLSGRIVALEEVDVSEEEWVARVAVELSLRKNESGKMVWNTLIEDTEPLQERSPAGLAEALSVLLTRIGSQTAPIIAEKAASAPPEGRDAEPAAN